MNLMQSYAYYFLAQVIAVIFEVLDSHGYDTLYWYTLYTEYLTKSLEYQKLSTLCNRGPWNI